MLTTCNLTFTRSSYVKEISYTRNGYTHQQYIHYGCEVFQAATQAHTPTKHTISLFREEHPPGMGENKQVRTSSLDIYKHPKNRLTIPQGTHSEYYLQWAFGFVRVLDEAARHQTLTCSTQNRFIKISRRRGRSRRVTYRQQSVRPSRMERFRTRTYARAHFDAETSKLVASFRASTDMHTQKKSARIL